MFLGFPGWVYNDPVLKIKKRRPISPRVTMSKSVPNNVLCDSALLNYAHHHCRPLYHSCHWVLQCTYYGHHHCNTLFVVLAIKTNVLLFLTTRLTTIANTIIDINLHGQWHPMLGVHQSSLLLRRLLAIQTFSFQWSFFSVNYKNLIRYFSQCYVL